MDINTIGSSDPAISADATASSVEQLQVRMSENVLDQEELVVLSETPSDSTAMLAVTVPPSSKVQEHGDSSTTTNPNKGDHDEESQIQMELLNRRCAAFDLELHELSTMFQVSNQSPSAKSSPAISPAEITHPSSSKNGEDIHLQSFDCRLSAHDVLISADKSSSLKGTVTVQVDLKQNKITAIEPLFKPDLFSSITALLQDYLNTKCPPQITNVSIGDSEDAQSEVTSTILLDFITRLSISIERQLHKSQSRHPYLIRDFAYPVSSPLHWGRFQLVYGQRMKQVKAIYDFDGQDENELSFNVGDVVDIIYEREDGWLVGLMNGLTGLVPINHVQYVDA